jgi:NAD-dependent deacetylase
LSELPHVELAAIRESLTPETRITVLTGAGISAASGIPTFRGDEDSLWNNYRPEELATPTAFDRDPELVWRWYDWRRGLIAQAEPNAAHLALVHLQDRARVHIVTQNVDGLHDRAGSRNVLEFHGSIWRVRCLSCGREMKDNRVPIPVLPRCEVCHGLLRPAVIWFGEAINPEVLDAAVATTRQSQLFIVIGTSGAVYPAAGLAALARESGARTLEFNLVPSEISAQMDLFVPGNAADTVPLLVS